MARGPRREAESGIHHVMNRGVDHGAVFFGDADRIEFGRRLAAVHEELGVTVLAYCLMDNHFHLLLDTPPGTLSTAMQRALGIYTRHTNDRIGRDGPLFRGRFHSIPVETDGYLVMAARYIHRNPLDLPGIISPSDHRWSSLRTYRGLRPVPDFVDLEPVSRLLGGRAAVVAHAEEEGPDRLVVTTFSDLRQLVELAIAADDLCHPGDTIGRQWLARTIVTLVAERSRDEGLRDIVARELDHPSARAASSARARARHRLEADPVVRRALRRVEAALTTDSHGATPRSGSDPLRGSRRSGSDPLREIRA